MNVLVVGATGATGSLLVKQLLDRNHRVKAIVRDESKLSPSLRVDERLELAVGTALDMSNDQLRDLLHDCDAVASCLGHNLNLSGIYGEPRRLVTNTAKLLCNLISKLGKSKPTKYVLMNTAGCQNEDQFEPVPLSQKAIVGLIRSTLPPHADNEDAANFFRKEIGQDHDSIEWAVVRPDSLKNESEVSDYSVHFSPTRSAIFNPGKTSRINVAHFMAELITDEDLWLRWQGTMPVIYNNG